MTDIATGAGAADDARGSEANMKPNYRSEKDTEELRRYRASQHGRSEARMTVLDYLRRHRRCEAAHIAAALGMPIEAIYIDLVAAEGRGLARVIVHREPVNFREWVAMTHQSGER